MTCKGWKNGCKCNVCLRLEGILTDPSINSEEDIQSALKRKWRFSSLQQGKRTGERKKKKD